MSVARRRRAAPRSTAAALLVGLVAGAAASPARAQDVDLERFVPALDAEGFLGVQGSRTPGHLRTSFGAFANYTNGLFEWPTTEAVEGIVIDDDAGDIAFVEHRAALALSAELGLGARAALALTAPLVLYQTDDVPPATEADDLPAFAVSDPGLHARYRLLGDAGEDRRDGPGLGVQAGASAPLGNEDAFAGEGAVRAYGQLLFDMHLLGLGVGTSVGVRHVFQGEDAVGPDRKPEMTFGAALKVPIPPLYPLAGLLEVRGATDFQSSETTVIEGELGGWLGLGEWTLTLAVGAGLHGVIGSPDLRAIAGVWYTPSVSDTDGDGVTDSDDHCPPLPEDRDGHEDGDGCPDPDNDSDLVPDVDDLCPNQEALEDRDANEDGCTD